MTRPVSVLLLALVAWGAHAADRGLDATALGEALAIGRGQGDAARARFHAPYRVPVGQAPVDYLDLITPFRAVVLAAEARVDAGASTLGLKDAQAIAAATGGLTVVQVELTFHPMNTFIGVPPYVVLLVSDGETVPLSVGRTPRFGPRVKGTVLGDTPSRGVARTPGGTQPLTGGTLVCPLPERLDPRGTFDLLVKDGSRVLARVPVDLANVR